MMRTAWLIARKDLSIRMRDWSAFLWGIVAPLGLAFIFSFVFNPIQNSTFSAEYAVVDDDGGPVAGQFVGLLEGLGDEYTIRSVATVEDAIDQVETGSDAFAGDDQDKADAAFHIPSGLSDSLLNGRGGKIIVIGAAGSELAAQVAYSVANGFASGYDALNVAVQTAIPQGIEIDHEVRGAMFAEAAQEPELLSLKDVSTGTRQLSQTTYLAAGMAVFFLFFTVSFGVSGLLEEKRIGTMDRLLAAPINRNSIILGKALTSFVLGIVSMGVLVIATTLLLGASWGNPLGVAMLVVAAVFSAMGILAIVAATAKTQDQAGSFQAIISLVLAFLGGTFFSISQVGGILEKLSLVTPHAWFLRGLGDLQSGELSAVYPAVGALLAFGVVTSSIAWTFMQRAVRR